MILAHKITLDPNKDQEAHLLRACGTARFAYNWALEEWQRQYEAGEKPNILKLKVLWNKIRKERFPWSLEVTKCASNQAILNLGKAFDSFFKKHSGYPKFKKRNVYDRFALWNDQFSVKGCKIRIPKLGWVRMREALRFSGKILSAIVSRTADKWFVSINVDTEATLQSSENQTEAVGVDLGIKNLAVLSTGEVVEGLKVSCKLVKKLARLSRSLSRKARGSANWNKAKVKLAKLYAKIKNMRRDSTHKFTTRLVRDFAIIGIEDLSVKEMFENCPFARLLGDQAFAEIRRQLEYKCLMTGSILIVHDRYFPSSKTCSSCGFVLKELPLSVREWICPECGVVHDRDLNAAINLKPTAVDFTVAACGAEGSGRKRERSTKPAALNQELLHAPKSA